MNTALLRTLLNGASGAKWFLLLGALGACGGHHDSAKPSVPPPNTGAASPDGPTKPILSLLAGSPPRPGAIQKVGTTRISIQPSAVTIDPAGNMYIAYRYLSIIRKVTVAGVVTTLAGSAGVAGSADGLGTAASLNLTGGELPGLAADKAGNLFLADTSNDVIRKITADGNVTTIAGLAGQSGSADGTGSSARFSHPSGLAIDANGHVFVADTDNHVIRRIDAAGRVTTVAGVPGNAGWRDGPASRAQFNGPVGLAIDAAGNLYVCDTGNATVRKITTLGVVSTLAGTAGVPGRLDGRGAGAHFDDPVGIATDPAGNLYVTERRLDTVRRITPAGVVTTLAGAAGVEGARDGAGGGARFSAPIGVATDGAGTVYVADADNNAIRRMSPDGVVSTVAAIISTDDKVKPTPDSIVGRDDGDGSTASFNDPSSIASDAAGNVYVADTGNNLIRKVTPAGRVTTLAGKTGEEGIGFKDASGSSARFDSPVAVTCDAHGNVYVADLGNHAIRKITPNGSVSTVAKDFAILTGVTADSAGNLYVAEASAHQVNAVEIEEQGTSRIRKIGTDGTLTTLAASTHDGLNLPRSLATDAAGNVYAADTGNSKIFKITPAGMVTPLAGSGDISIGNVDGSGANASFRQPRGLTVDRSGNVYVADTGDNTVRKITPAGIVSTIAGQPKIQGFVPGDLPGQLKSPVAVAIAGSTLFVVTANAIVQISHVP